MKSQIIKLRKKIYKNLKEKASSYETLTPEIKQYYSDQKKYSKRKFNICDIEQIKENVLDSNLFFLGDFHTFDQNIRNVLRIIKVILSNNSNCAIGLEMISSKFQSYVDAYMDHHITDLEFLELINYNESWRFPWSHYKLVFDLAKKHNIKIIALNTQGSLFERDQHACNIISEITKESPGTKVVILYGELHITINKIPKMLKELRPELKQTIIHQNLDEVYWKLIEQGIEQGIVSFSENEYCIISAPPWIKYESMIYWFENICNDPDFDIHEYIIEKGKKIFSEDTSENFYNICTDLISHLHLELDLEVIEDFTLYDHTRLEFVEENLESHLKQSLLAFYQHLISNNESFRLPHTTKFYCSSYSMNRISYLAGIHIFHTFLNKNNETAIKILDSKSIQSKFILFTLENMFGYFFSKIINPHRKCEMYFDLKKSLSNTPQSMNQKLILEKSLHCLDRENLFKILTGLNTKTIHEISLNVGHILGEYLYLNYSRNEDKNFSAHNLERVSLKPSYFLELKKKLLNQNLYHQDSKRYF